MILWVRSRGTKAGRARVVPLGVRDRSVTPTRLPRSPGSSSRDASISRRPSARLGSSIACGRAPSSSSSATRGTTPTPRDHRGADSRWALLLAPRWSESHHQRSRPMNPERIPFVAAAVVRAEITRSAPKSEAKAWGRCPGLSPARHRTKRQRPGTEGPYRWCDSGAEGRRRGDNASMRRLGIRQRRPIGKALRCSFCGKR